MKNLIKTIKHKVNGIIMSLVSTGIFLLILGILIVWTDFMLRILIGMFVLVVAYAFLHGAYKVWAIKKQVEKHFKL